MNNKDAAWETVRDYIPDALGMYWDGCHKIYLSMDEEDVAKMADYGYDFHEPDFDLLKEWFDQSCGLRFVSAVHTNHDDPNAGYESLIPQFAFDDEEEWD
jgi:hypothetical protein